MPSPTELAAQLHSAIEDGDAEAVARALEAGASPTAVDEEGVPLILYAADRGHVRVVRALLDAGAPVDIVDDIGYTPLHSAITGPHLPLMEVLLAAGADPNHLLNDDVNGGATPLTSALERQPSTPLLRVLLAAGADPNLPRRDGWTPLMIAAQQGDLAAVRMLLDAGADAAASKGDPGLTAADIAAHWKQGAVLAALRMAGAPEPDGACAVRIAGLWGAIDEWFRRSAPPCHEELASLTGATDDQIAALEAAIGQEIPVDLRAHLARYGGGYGAPFYEYAGLSAAAAAGSWEGLEDLRRKGTFDAWEPREIGPDEERVQRTWWHPGWVPFAQDGGGNLRCVDLAPGPAGIRGQVIGWEIHGGPTAPIALSLEDFLREFRDRLASGRLRYDPDSGVFIER